MINIKGLDKAQLLIELYNHSHQQGLGIMQPSRSLTIEDAKKLLEQTTDFDYLYGRVMKVDLSDDEEFEERLYDLDNGQGMAQLVVDSMRKKLEKANTIDDLDTNIDLLIDVTDTYMGIYKQVIVSEDGSLSEIIKAGLFKKDRIYYPKGIRPVQSYIDILSGNTASLLLDEDGKDIVTSNVMGNIDLLPSVYSIGYYSLLMQKIEEQEGIKPFTSEFVGRGLMKTNQFAPKLQGKVPLSTVLQELAMFGKLTESRDPEVQESILASLKEAEKNAINRLPLNDIDLSENFNKNTSR